jgi:hypothetical protein
MDNIDLDDPEEYQPRRGPYPLREDEQLQPGSGPYSPEEVALIGKLLKSGDWTQTQIARATTRNQSTVSKLAKRLGIDAMDVQEKMVPARAVLAGTQRTRQLAQAVEMGEQISRLLLQMRSPVLRMKQTSDGTVHTYKSMPSAAEQRDTSISIGVLTDKRSLILRDQPSDDGRQGIIGLFDAIRDEALKEAGLTLATAQLAQHVKPITERERLYQLLVLEDEKEGKVARAIEKVPEVQPEPEPESQPVPLYGISREHSNAIT